jgi:hypothetical protein
MDPIEELSDRVAALAGRDLALSEVHQFILDAAELLAPAVPVVTGNGVWVRWGLGERTVVVAPHRFRSMLTLAVHFFNSEYTETHDYHAFKWGMADDMPFRWSMVLGERTTSVFDWWRQCGLVGYNWDYFDRQFDSVLDSLPEDLELMPPQWRREVVYRWDMSVSGLGVVTLRATHEGIEISSAATGESVMFPQGRTQGMGAVLAGLAGGAPLKKVPMLESSGFDAGPITLDGSEPEVVLREIEMIEENNNEGIRPDTDDNRRPALTFADLRARLGEPDEETVSRAYARAEHAVLPMRWGLSLGQLHAIVRQWSAGAQMDRVLMELGAVPGTYLNDEALVGKDWVAVTGRVSSEWEIVVSPDEEHAMTDNRQLAAAAWQLSQEFQDVYGSPFAGRTSSSFGFSRFFRIGDRGLAINTFLGLRVVFGSFEKLAFHSVYG